jgi:chromate transporter
VTALGEATASPGARTSLREIGGLFLRLGATAFGGPAAHVAMMRDEVVDRRGWLTQGEFFDLVSATNLIPGPNSTELAIHIGWQRRRFAGLVVAGVSFIVPAMLITGAMGWAYVRYGSLPSAGWILYGVEPIVLAIVAQALWIFAHAAARTTWLRVLAGVAIVLAAVGVHELAVLFGVGAVALATSRRSGAKRTSARALAPFALLAPASLGGVAGSISLGSLALVFLKAGSLLFGSGYVLLAFLRADLVERLGWLTEAQLVDAISVGQITPGPVFTTATFIGYVLLGPWGAVVATVGIFLPAFVFVAASGPLVPRLRASPRAAAFLDGLNAASLALMVVVTFQLGRHVLVDVPSWCLFVLGAVVLLRFKPNSAWLVLGGSLAGLVLHSTGLSR